MRSYDLQVFREGPGLLLASLFALLVSLLLPAKLALLATAVLFGYLAYRRPFESLLFLILYVSIRPVLLELNDGVKLIGDVITLVLTAKMLWLHRGNWRSLLRFRPFEWAFFAFLAFGAIIGLLDHVSFSAVLFQVRTFAIMYLLYFVVSRAELPAWWLRHAAWTTVAGTLLCCVQGIIEKLSLRGFLMPQIWKYKTLSATNFVRIYGLPGNPNSLALMLLFGILALAFLMYHYRGRAYKWPLRLCLVLFLGTLVLTYSRGTWISLAVLAALYAVQSRDWRSLKQLAIAGVAALVLVYFPVNLGVKLAHSLGVDAPEGAMEGSIGDRFGETFDKENLQLMSESGRLFYIKKGFEVFRDYPITGAGFGTFGGSATLSYKSPIYDRYGIRSDIYGGKYFYSDNQYIQVIAETGVVGVALFGAFLVLMLGEFWKRRSLRFAQVMIALWFATGVSGMYYNIWELKLYTMFFFLLFGVFASLHMKYAKYRL